MSPLNPPVTIEYLCRDIDRLDRYVDELQDILKNNSARIEKLEKYIDILTTKPILNCIEKITETTSCSDASSESDEIHRCGMYD